jgi:hypothetical protein
MFDFINDTIRGAESSFVNLISAIAPWLAPLAPAFMTFQHATDKVGLNFPLWVAIPIALVVEILGFSTVSTLLAFHFYNRRNRYATRKAPVAIVVFAFSFYLALIVTSNVVLDATENSRTALVVVRAMLTLQTVPAALIVAVRTQHRDLIHQIERERTMPNSSPNHTVKQPVLRRTFASLTNEDKVAIMSQSTSVSAELCGVTVRAVEKWIVRIKAAQ